MEWVRACNANSLSNGDLISFDYNNNNNNNNRKILIAKIQDKIYATDGISTHEYADLSIGFLNEQEKTVYLSTAFVCFKLDNGIPQNPPAKIPLKTYNVKIEDNEVYVMIEMMKHHKQININCL
jgi:3-phenylpropionate/trans-cinnamate dioxygenase ferredoxin subunit